VGGLSVSYAPVDDGKDSLPMATCEHLTASEP